MYTQKGILGFILAAFSPMYAAAPAAAAAAKEKDAPKEVERVRKITLGVIKVQPDIEVLLAAEGKRMECADIYGIAKKAKPGQSDFGPYVAFLGSFRAVRLSDGQVFESSKIILPQFLEEDLFACFGEGLEGDVEFAFRITAKYDKESATKYVYDAKPLIKPAENTQLENLLARVNVAAKALPAPKS